MTSVKMGLPLQRDGIGSNTKATNLMRSPFGTSSKCFNLTAHYSEQTDARLKKSNPSYYELNVLPGKADELKAIASKMVNMNAAEELGTLVYNVYLDEDETLFTYLETDSDAETGLFHVKRFVAGEYVGQILERTDGGRLCFYGAVSDEFKQWAADNGFEPEYYSLIDGYVR